MNKRKAISGIGALLGATVIKSKAAVKTEIDRGYSPTVKNSFVRKNRVLSDGWQFQIDIKDIGEKEQWHANTFNTGDWTTSK
ncbi:hypothetical protein [Mucilaginibacter sp. SP1R1]|uniref:hypothetical protein n=1 Tax=Mucilaginibacter sp. SP1R1 TaxID=2723091 RepID=UPI00160C159F|nr:hypothetical protein [Mucilaginibacter sp. SP1R1]MBB6148330.1 hypothetical protein [Mucilaginibacter sp. SP1R1]